jgi:tetratricopeptide (TPR) repeat protein
MRKLNPIFLGGLVAVCLVLGGATYFVHVVQIQSNARVLLDRAHKDEDEGKLARAAESLKQYLNLKNSDGVTWRWYARVLDKLDADGSRRAREQVFMVHEEALRHNPGDSELERRCADLALECGRAGDAERHLQVLLDKLPEQVKTGPKAAELEELLAMCDLQNSKFQDADTKLEHTILHDRSRINCYVLRARLARSELRQNPTVADDLIKRMVRNNPDSGLAYLHCYRYNREFSPTADAADLKKALVLAPEDPDVLISAALDAEQRKDFVAARAHVEKGLKLDPKNTAFARKLASLENRERHPERAEAILRSAVQTRPDTLTVLALASNLIEQGKTTGKEGAGDYIAILRNRGLGQSYVRCLEAQIKMRQKDWAGAIKEIEAAQLSPFLKTIPEVAAMLDMMLAECQGRRGYGEERLTALRHAVDVKGTSATEASRLELASALVRSSDLGQIDQGLRILQTMTEQRPELELEITRILIQKTLRQAREKRNWQSVKMSFEKARQRNPMAADALDVLGAELLAAQDRLEEARQLVSKAVSRSPKNLGFRLILASLAQSQQQDVQALSILDQAKKDLGPSLGLDLAYLGYWGRRGGDQAKAEVARLAELRKRDSAAEEFAFLEQLARTELQLGAPERARQHWAELAALQPENLPVLLDLFELAREADDQAEMKRLIARIRDIERDEGVYWRYASALSLINVANRAQAASAGAKVGAAAPELAEARALAEQIGARRGEWWGSDIIQAEIAELESKPDNAIQAYKHAVDKGHRRPEIVRRLVSLLGLQNRLDEIEPLAAELRDRDEVPQEIRIADALIAMRKREYDRGLELARQAFPEQSKTYTDHVAMGRFYLMAQKLPEAAKAFQRAVVLAPGVAETWLNYIRTLVQTGQIDAAKKATKDVQKAALPADRVKLTLAKCRFMIGDTKEGQSLLQAAVKEQPNDPATLRVAASVSLLSGRLDEVEKYLGAITAPAAAATADDLAWARRTRVTLSLRGGRLSDIEAAERLVDQNPDEKPASVEDLKLKAAVMALRPNRRVEAIRILKKLDDARELDPTEQFQLARHYLDERMEKEFEDKVLKILLDRKSGPPNAQHLAFYINYLIKSERLDQAQRWLTELKTIEPRGLTALEAEANLVSVRHPEGTGPEFTQLREQLNHYGQEHPDQIGAVALLHNRLGFWSEAEKGYKRFIDQDRTKPERELVLASFQATRRDQNQTAQAIELLSHAWTTCPPEQVAIAALSVYDAPSITLAQQKQVEAWLVEASRRRPDLVVLSTRLAAIWIRQGRFDEAEVLYRQILDSHPESSEALNNLAWLLALRDQSKTEEALGLIDRAIGLSGRSPSLLDTRAVVLIRSGRLAEAANDLRDARSLDARNANVPLHLAWASQAEGKMAQALKAYDEAIKLGWKAERSDPLERAFIDKLRQEIKR